MIRSKIKFYWSDALYLARTKNLLTLKEDADRIQTFQCPTCSAFVKFDAEVAGGQWRRIKPYEQSQLRKKFGDAEMQSEALKEIESHSKTRKLFQCPNCASHWWRDETGWTHADDEMVETI
jgi:predicted RNA-binding Zn-ribbon protein involved in translation (DUF1610 family)